MAVRVDALDFVGEEWRIGAHLFLYLSLQHDCFLGWGGGIGTWLKFEGVG